MRSLFLIAVLVTVTALPLAAQIALPTAPGSQSVASKLTAAQVAAWKDKSVYSSDAKKIGEVKSFGRASDDSVLKMTADPAKALPKIQK